MTSRRALWALTGLFVLLSITYALATPLLESPDESSHLQVIHYIATYRTLPPYALPEMTAKTGEGMAWLISYHDPTIYYAPPLYHSLGALLTFWSPMDDLQARLIPNPAWTLGWAPTRDTDAWNKNVFVHLPDETWRGSATVRAATILRAFSLLCSVVTLWCAYHIALHILPERRDIAFGTAAIIALNPQFIANAVAVSNDPLTIALCSGSVLLMLRSLRLPEEKRLLHWLWLGMLTSTACLVKQSCLMLVPLGGLTLLLYGWQKRENGTYPWLDVIRLGLLFGIVTLGVCGWWYVRNLILFGDLLGTAPHYATDVALHSFGLREIWDTFTSFWACFGWQVINLPEWVYILLAFVTFVALGALAFTLIRTRRIWTKNMNYWQPALILLALFLMNAVAFVRWAVATGAPYGRLLYPSVVPVALALSGGLHSLHNRGGTWSRRILLVAMIVVCAVTPWLVIAPTFRSPVLDTLPKDAQVLNQRFANGLTLLGYTQDQRQAHPGDTVTAILYWQADTELDAIITMWAQLAALDPTQRIAEDTRWLGGTLYPTKYWRAGDIVAQRLILNLPEGIDSPSMYWLRVGLSQDDDAHSPVLLDNGAFDTTLFVWEVRPQKQPRVHEQDCIAVYDESLCLLDAQTYATEQGFALELRWQALDTPVADYTLFIHAVGEGNNVTAQVDAPPKQGAFPTQVWRRGDVISETLFLDTSIATHLLLGWYDPITTERVPVTASQDEIRPDQTILITLP